MQAIQVFNFNPGKLCLPGHCLVTSVVIFLCLGAYSITGLGPEDNFIATGYKGILDMCFQLVATVWRRPTYGCVGQVLNRLLS